MGHIQTGAMGAATVGEAVMAELQRELGRTSPAAFSDQPTAFSDQPAAFSDQPAAFSDQPAAFSDQPAAFSDQPGAFSDSPPAAFSDGTGRRQAQTS